MANRHSFKEFAERNRQALAEDRHLRWAYIEEKLRIRFSERLRRVMDALGLTQAEVAAKSETTQPMVSRFLKGEDTRSPSLETLVKWADAVGGEIEDIIWSHPKLADGWETIPSVTVCDEASSSFKIISQTALKSASAQRLADEATAVLGHRPLRRRSKTAATSWMLVRAAL